MRAEWGGRRPLSLDHPHDGGPVGGLDQAASLAAEGVELPRKSRK